MVRSRLLRGVALLAVSSALISCGGVVDSAGDPTDGRASCRDATPGADVRCAVSQDVDCCGWSDIPGGTFDRLNDPALPATVSSFKLDLFEATVGRFRAFVDAYPGSRPKPGDGAHSRIPNSGWKAEWDAALPATRDDLVASLHVGIFDRPCVMWTDEPGPNENAPMGCLNWYEAFAFCAWDHGRLPTLAEWEYAAAGGAEQRVNPWGAAPYGSERAVYDNPPNGPLIPVGSKPDGRAKWGQYDLGGSRNELILDFTSELGGITLRDLPVPCNDCADLGPKYEKVRAVRDLNWFNLPSSVVERLTMGTDPRVPDAVVGVRCVYEP